MRRERTRRVDDALPRMTRVHVHEREARVLEVHVRGAHAHAQDDRVRMRLQAAERFRHVARETTGAVVIPSVVVHEQGLPRGKVDALVEQITSCAGVQGRLQRLDRDRNPEYVQQIRSKYYLLTRPRDHLHTHTHTHTHSTTHHTLILVYHNVAPVRRPRVATPPHMVDAHLWRSARALIFFFVPIGGNMRDHIFRAAFGASDNVTFMAIALGVDAESPVQRFEDPPDTLHGAVQDTLHKEFHKTLSNTFPEMLKYMEKTKTLRVFDENYEKRLSYWWCSWERKTRRQLMSESSTLEREDMAFLDAFVTNDGKFEWNTSVTDIHDDMLCNATYIKLKDVSKKGTTFVITEQREVRKMKSGAKFPNPTTPCTVVSRFKNIAAIPFQNLKKTLVLGTPPVRNEQPKLWMGVGGGNDVISSYVYSLVSGSENDVVMNSVGVHQFLHYKWDDAAWARTPFDKFFPEFYKRAIPQLPLVNLTQTLRDMSTVYTDMMTTWYDKLESTSTILFELEVARISLKMGREVYLFILPELDKNYKKIDMQLQASPLPPPMTLSINYERAKTSIGNKLRDEGNPYERVFADILHDQMKGKHTILLDTGGDIFTGGRDERSSGSDDQWFRHIETQFLNARTRKGIHMARLNPRYKKDTYIVLLPTDSGFNEFQKLQKHPVMKFLPKNIHLQVYRKYEDNDEHEGFDMHDGWRLTQFQMSTHTQSARPESAGAKTPFLTLKQALFQNKNDVQIKINENKSINITANNVLGNHKPDEWTNPQNGAHAVVYFRNGDGMSPITFLKDKNTLVKDNQIGGTCEASPRDNERTIFQKGFETVLDEFFEETGFDGLEKLLTSYASEYGTLLLQRLYSLRHEMMKSCKFVVQLIDVLYEPDASSKTVADGMAPDSWPETVELGKTIVSENAYQFHLEGTLIFEDIKEGYFTEELSRSDLIATIRKYETFEKSKKIADKMFKEPFKPDKLTNEALKELYEKLNKKHDRVFEMLGHTQRVRSLQTRFFQLVNDAKSFLRFDNRNIEGLDNIRAYATPEHSVTFTNEYTHDDLIKLQSVQPLESYDDAQFAKVRFKIEGGETAYIKTDKLSIKDGRVVRTPTSKKGYIPHSSNVNVVMNSDDLHR